MMIQYDQARRQGPYGGGFGRPNPYGLPPFATHGTINGPSIPVSTGGGFQQPAPVSQNGDPMGQVESGPSQVAPISTFNPPAATGGQMPAPGFNPQMGGGLPRPFGPQAGPYGMFQGLFGGSNPFMGGGFGGFGGGFNPFMGGGFGGFGGGFGPRFNNMAMPFSPSRYGQPLSFPGGQVPQGGGGWRGSGLGPNGTAYMGAAPQQQGMLTGPKAWMS